MNFAVEDKIYIDNKKEAQILGKNAREKCLESIVGMQWKGY